MDAVETEVLLQRVGIKDAVEWGRGRTLNEIWHASPSGKLLLKLALEAGVARRRVLGALCACVRLTLKYTQVEGPQYEPLDTPCVPIALELAEAWARGAPGVELDAVRAMSVEAHDAASLVDCMESYGRTPYPPGAVHATFAVAFLLDAVGVEDVGECSNHLGNSFSYAEVATAAQHGHSEESRREFRETCARVVRDFIRAEDVAMAVATSRR
ncbi:hypothetical protein DRW03_03240 [Corallococcus sp. H22C18031201]|nr:hypothetical protein DRW03_03240 [Corallococcus sp. H22C18031201]